MNRSRTIFSPNFKKTQHTIDIHCPDDLSIKCAPGVLAQILTQYDYEFSDPWFRR